MTTLEGKPHTMHISTKLAALVAVPGLLLFGAAATAQASTATAHAGPAVISPTTDVNEVGDAGYVTFGPVFNSNQAIVTIQPSDATMTLTSSLSDPGSANGIGLCNNNDGTAEEIGYLRTGTNSYSVAAAVGDLEGSPGGNPCRNSEILHNGTLFSFGALTDLPAGEQLSLKVHESKEGNFLFTAEDLTTQDAVWSKWISGPDVGYREYDHEALAGGFFAIESGISAPAVNLLTPFTELATTNCASPLGTAPCWTRNYARNTAVQVVSSANGVAPWLLTPDSSLSPSGGTSEFSSFNLFVGTQVSP